MNADSQLKYENRNPIRKSITEGTDFSIIFPEHAFTGEKSIYWTIIISCIHIECAANKGCGSLKGDGQKLQTSGLPIFISKGKPTIYSMSSFILKFDINQIFIDENAM